MTRVKVGLLFLGRKRPGFDVHWGAGMEACVREAVDRQDWDVFRPEQKIVDDASLRAALAACRQAEVETIVLLQTTMSDGRMAPTLAQHWPAPPVVWATPENPEGDMVSSCSLVGTHVWATSLKHLGRTCEIVYGHPGEVATRQRLAEAVQLTALAQRMNALRMALIGGQAPGFFTMQGDLFSMHKALGVQLHSHTLIEFSDVVKGIDDRDIVEDVAAVKRLGFAHKDTSDDDLPMASRLYLAMRHFLDVEQYDALAIRCWPEIPNVFGQWPYLGLSRLAEEGRAVACEGDVDGALTAWIGEQLGMGHCFLTDWLEHDRTTITFWHGGMAPASLSPPPGEPGGPRIARHFNSKKPAVVDSELKPDMPVTIWRLWRCDGRYFLAAREGRTLPPRRQLMGTYALVELDGGEPHAWFERLCHRGMPHHVSLHAGLHADKLRRMARLLNIIAI